MAELKTNDLEQMAREVLREYERYLNARLMLCDYDALEEVITQALAKVQRETRVKDVKVLDAIIARVGRGGNDMFVTAMLCELKQAAAAIEAQGE